MGASLWVERVRLWDAAGQGEGWGDGWAVGASAGSGQGDQVGVDRGRCAGAAAVDDVAPAVVGEEGRGSAELSCCACCPVVAGGRVVQGVAEEQRGASVGVCAVLGVGDAGGMA